MGAIHTKPRPGSICVTSDRRKSDCPGATRLSHGLLHGPYTAAGIVHGCMYSWKRVRTGGNDLSLHRGLLMRALSATDSSRAWLVAPRRAKGA